MTDEYVTQRQASLRLVVLPAAVVAKRQFEGAPRRPCIPLCLIEAPHSGPIGSSNLGTWRDRSNVDRAQRSVSVSAKGDLGLLSR